MSGRLDDAFKHAPNLDDLDEEARKVCRMDEGKVWTPADLKKLREIVTSLDAKSEKVWRTLK